MDQVYIVLNDLGKFNAILQGHAALHALGAGHTVFNQKVITADLLDLLTYHNGELGTVCHGAAVFIGTMVELGRDELVQQPAVAAVEIDHLEAQRFGDPCNLGPLIRSLFHHLNGHLFDLYAVVTHIGRGADGILVTGDGIGMVHGTHMVELNGGNRTVGLDGFRQRHDGLHMEGGHGLFPEVQAVLMPPGILVVNEGLGEGDFRKAAPGLGLIDINALRGGIAVIYDPVGCDRRSEYTVLKGDALDGHGLKHMWVLGAGHKYNFLSSYGFHGVLRYA